MTKETYIKELDKILKRVTTIEELETIIIETGNIEETKIYFGKTVFKNPQEIKNEVMELLNNHISKLRGEQK